MNDSHEATTPMLGQPGDLRAVPASVSWRNFGLVLAALLAGFSLPLVHLTRFAFESQMYSHVVLMPFISLYLVWMKRRDLPPRSAPDLRLVVVPAVAGVALLAIGFVSPLSAEEDGLAVTTLSFVFLFYAVCAVFLGRRTIRALAFPLGMLVFMAPFPVAVTAWIETALQNSSADAAYLFFTLGGTTVFKQDTYLQLPGIKLLVAPECSGMHSTLALLITSLLAGNFFLRSNGKRAVLTLAIIPVAILRNGFRIFVVGELCVRIGPEMINSYVHRHGGPLFFILSLVPFSLIMWGLMRSERRAASPAGIAR